MISASQQMLFIYSVGSIFGPIAAHYFMLTSSGLFEFIFVILTATAIYMLLISIKGSHQIVAPK